jgi:hypothetical protein
MNLFDSAEAERRKEAGMAMAAAANAQLLAVAQRLALEIAQARGLVCADDVALEMHRLGLDYQSLGNAAGSVFRGRFEWTGNVVASDRVSTHGRMIKVWRIK